jgi:hypothetical protein
MVRFIVLRVGKEKDEMNGGGVASQVEQAWVWAWACLVVVVLSSFVCLVVPFSVHRFSVVLTSNDVFLFFSL